MPLHSRYRLGNFVELCLFYRINAISDKATSLQKFRARFPQEELGPTTEGDGSLLASKTVVHAPDAAAAGFNQQIETISIRKFVGFAFRPSALHPSGG